MLDTIRLTLQNVPETVLKDRKDGERWTLQTTEDGHIERKYLIHRLNKSEDDGKYNGTIGISYDTKNQYLNVGVSSLPALIHGTSFKTLAREDLKTIKETVYKQVSPFVDIDMDEAKLTRLDNSMVYTMDKTPDNYICLLDSITRSKQHRMNKTYYQNQTLQFRNNQRCIGVYDKYGKNIQNDIERRYLEEMEDHKRNGLRYEIQNKNSRSIKHLFGKNLILNDILKDEFIETLHRQRVVEFDKHFKLHQKIERIENILKVKGKMKSTGRQYTLNDAVFYQMMRDDYLSLDDIKKLMELSGYSRQAVHQRIIKLTEIIQQDIEVVSMFEELKQKIEFDIAV